MAFKPADAPPTVALILFSIAALLLPSAGADTQSLEDRVADLYRPFQAEDVSLSPDGKRVAYTQHEAGALSVVILSVDGDAPKMNVLVERDRDVPLAHEKQPVRLSYLRWFAPDLVVIAPTERVERSKILKPVYVFDANRRDFRELLDSTDFAVTQMAAMDPATPRNAENEKAEMPSVRLVPRHIAVIGPAADDPEGLLIEASPSPASVFEVNVRSGKQTELDEGSDRGRLLYDWRGKIRILYSLPSYSGTRTFSVLTKGLLGHWKALGIGGDGPSAREFTVTTDNYFGHRAMPLGFDFDPKLLYYASNVGRDTFGVYQIDLDSGRRTAVGVEDPHVDLSGLDPAFPARNLVYDVKRRLLAGVRGEGVTPFTLWVDPELRGIQRMLDRRFDGQTVEILQWDDARDRYLLRVTSAVPSRYYVFERRENRFVEFLHSAPWLHASDLGEAEPIEFDSLAGVHLSGYLTYPLESRVDPPPLVALFPSNFLERARPGFDREAQVYAAMGFAVLRVNCRGSTGFGVAHREAILQGIDRVPVDDMLAAIDWVAQHRRIDVKRIAAAGEGFGGYLALRAAQLHQNRFRCAVSMDAPLDLENWLQPPSQAGSGLTQVTGGPGRFGTPGATIDLAQGAPPVDFRKESIRTWLARSRIRFADISVARNAELLSQPVFLILNPLGDSKIVGETVALRSKLGHLGHPPAYLELGSDYVLGLAGARARVFQQIEEFLNLSLYDYSVRMGPLKEIK